MVRSPATASSSSAFLVTPVDLKVSAGNFSASKKSALFRWASRCSSPVWMEAAWIEASTVDLVMSCSSICRVPGQFGELPFHVRNHHVFNLELGHGMGGVQVPGAYSAWRGNQCAHDHCPFTSPD